MLQIRAIYILTFIFEQIVILSIFLLTLNNYEKIDLAGFSIAPLGLSHPHGRFDLLRCYLCSAIKN